MARVLVLLVLGSMLPGCLPAWPYSTMASHTLRTAPDKDIDVVWVQDIKGRLYRCNAGAEGPVCVAVKL